MTKVSVVHPNSEGCKFDIAFQCHSHMAMAKDTLINAARGKTGELHLQTP